MQCIIPNPQTRYTDSVFSSHPSLRGIRGSISICSAVQHTRLQNWFTGKNCWVGGTKKKLTDLMIEFLSLMNMNVSADTRKKIVWAWEQDWMTFLAGKMCVKFVLTHLQPSAKRGYHQLETKGKGTVPPDHDKSVTVWEKIRQQWWDPHSYLHTKDDTDTWYVIKQ